MTENVAESHNPFGLTARQLEVLQVITVAEGYQQQVAALGGISPMTLKNTLTTMFKRVPERSAFKDASTHTALGFLLAAQQAGMIDVLEARQITDEQGQIMMNRLAESGMLKRVHREYLAKTDNESGLIHNRRWDIDGKAKAILGTKKSDYAILVYASLLRQGVVPSQNVSHIESLRRDKPEVIYFQGECPQQAYELAIGEGFGIVAYKIKKEPGDHYIPKPEISEIFLAASSPEALLNGIEQMMKSNTRLIYLYKWIKALCESYLTGGGQISIGELSYSVTAGDIRFAFIRYGQTTREANRVLDVLRERLFPGEVLIALDDEEEVTPDESSQTV